MTDEQLNSIQRRIHPEVIASKYYNRKWPRELRYGHHTYCGLEMQDYRVKQRLRKIQIVHKILNHPKHSTLIESILPFYQLFAGTSQQVLEYPNKRINYVSSIWLKNLEILSYTRGISKHLFKRCSTIKVNMISAGQRLNCCFIFPAIIP